MISVETGIVEKIIWAREGIQCLEVKLGDKREKALNYPCLTGTALPGHRVILNTTAVQLGLGSGGYHFVMANYIVNSLPLSSNGHIIKMRYTPLQCKVQVYEEILGSKNSSSALSKYEGLKNVPVVIGELHSMVAPFVLTLKMLNPTRRIVYIMTDSAALPLYLSDTISCLKNDSLLEGTVTCGHAFGGDLETVNIYTALMAAREELKADVIFVAPGPGVVGTCTRYGYSGIEQGEHIDRVRKLQGLPVVIPRISFSDARTRHYGLSHHTLTALGEIASESAFLPLPLLDRDKMVVIYRQLKISGLLGKHKIVIVNKPQRLKFFQIKNFRLQTMGRGVKDDPAFFVTAMAAASFTERIIPVH
ncbi:MAG: DUF3866 family protein [Dethiobacter sp.]|jgi:hypothetical protein|nr:MAG: DUF3866 family protein [Dethiobacter sp.]